MPVNEATNSTPVCVTIDEVYGERPGPCTEDAPQAPSVSKEAPSAPDYFEDLLIQVMVEELAH